MVLEQALHSLPVLLSVKRQRWILGHRRLGFYKQTMAIDVIAAIAVRFKTVFLIRVNIKVYHH